MIGITPLRSRLSTVIREVRAGAEIVISVNGQPAAKLVPYSAPRIQATHVLTRGSGGIGIVDVATGKVEGSLRYERE